MGSAAYALCTARGLPSTCLPQLSPDAPLITACSPNLHHHIHTALLTHCCARTQPTPLAADRIGPYYLARLITKAPMNILQGLLFSGIM